MKQAFYSFLLLVAIASCKSDNTDLNNNQPVLLGYQSFNGAASEQVALDYDQANRITRVSRLQPNQPAVIIYDISYSGNEIRFLSPFTNNDSVTLSTEIVLTLDGDRVTKRVERTFFEFKQPVSIPQRSYIYDSIGYSYSGDLLTSRNGVHYDSTWFNPEPEQILRDTQIITETMVNTGGNISTSNRLINFISSREENGNVLATRRSMEEAVTYSYSAGYANKSDFLNQIILQEINVFNYGFVNAAYANIPDQVSSVVTDRDANGNITSTSNSQYSRLIAYNAEGYIITITDAANPQVKTTYFYNR